MRASYSGQSLSKSFHFDAEMVGNVITNMKRGKAAGVDGISAEHLQ